MKKELARECPFDKGYVELSKKYDINFGEYSMRRGRINGDLMLSKDFKTNAKAQVAGIVKTLEERRLMVHPNLMALRDYSCKEHPSFCSTFYHTTSFYEYYETNLLKFKEMAKDPNVDFNERVIVKILYDMVLLSVMQVSVLQFLQLNNITHGDIRPELIFISEVADNEKVASKLMDRLSDQGTSANTQLNNIMVNNNLYLSPKLFEKVLTGKANTGLDQFR